MNSTLERSTFQLFMNPRRKSFTKSISQSSTKVTKERLLNKLDNQLSQNPQHKLLLLTLLNNQLLSEKMHKLSLLKNHATSHPLLNSKETSQTRFTLVKLPHSDKDSRPTNTYMKDILRKVEDVTSSDQNADTSVNNHLSNSLTDNTFCLTLATSSQVDKPSLLELNTPPLVLNSLKVTTSMRDISRKVAHATSSDRDADTSVSNHPSCSRMDNTFCTLTTSHLVSPKVSQ